MSEPRADRLNDIDGPSEDDIFAADLMPEDVLANPLDMIVVSLNGLVLDGPNEDDEYWLDEDLMGVFKELSEKNVALFALADSSPEEYDWLREQFPDLLLFEETIITGEENLPVDDEEMWEVIEEATRHAGGLSDAFFVSAHANEVMAGEQAGVDGVVVTDAATLRAELRLRGLAVQ